MKVGLLGFAGSGKTTLYKAAAKGEAKGDITAVPVPDDRFDKIVAQVKPKKISPATVIFHDNLPSIQGDVQKKFSQQLIDNARKVDLLLHVVRGFESDMAPYYADVNPVRDQKAVEEELILLDLQIVENRLERLQKSHQSKSPGTQEYKEKVVFDKLIGPLSEGRPIRDIEVTEDDQVILKNYQFLSAKPLVVTFNLSEKELQNPSEALKSRIEELKKEGVMAFCVSAPIEEEISQLEPDDQKEFLDSLGVAEPAGARVIRAIYDGLGLVTFFTAGESDTRAWPLKQGSTALKAADTIHSDIARGFIRAEVVHYKDWEESGSWEAAHHANKMRLEGKEYIIHDGDLLNIRNKS